MPDVIELNFDAQTEAHVRDIWRELEVAGFTANLPGGTPHVSLAIGGTIDANAIAPTLQKFAAKYPPIPVALSAINQFPGSVVYLAPELSSELAKMHRAFHISFVLPMDELSRHYLPAAWRPHCTLAQGVAESDLPRVMEICSRTKLPIMGQFESISLVRWRPAVELTRFTLGLSPQ